MSDLNDIYRNEFSAEEVARQEREFEHGIGHKNEEFALDANDPLARREHQMTLIKTPGANNRREKNIYDTSFKQSVVAVPLASFTFSVNGGRQKKKPKKQSAAKKSKKATDSDYAPSSPDNAARADDDDDDDEVVFGDAQDNEEAALRQGMKSVARNERLLRSMVAKTTQDVVSKEVVADGGAGEQPVQVKFVSLREATKRQAERNYSSFLKESDDLCYSSCEELEKLLIEDEQRRRERHESYRAKKTDVARESFDDASFSNATSQSSTSSYRRKRHRDDDDDDDDMYYSTSESVSSHRHREENEERRSRDHYKTPSLTHSGSESNNGERNNCTALSKGGGSGPPNKNGGQIAGRKFSSTTECFLCRRGDKKYDSVSRKDMQDLLNLLEQGVGHTDPIELAKMVHKQYMSSIYQDGRLGGIDVPLWRTKSVLEHILYHENDPRYVLWLSIVNSRRIIDILSETSLVEHPQNGQIVPTKNIELRQKEEAHLLNLYRQKPEAMVFHNSSTQIDLGKNNKRVHGIVQKTQKRHYAYTEVAELDR